jgi:uncharacterized membrane protein YfcA
MARPHHRKKHREHLRQFQQRTGSNTGESKEKANASSIFAITGAVVGIAVLYFATQGNFIWAIGGGIAGGAVGYLIGRGIDKPLKK